MAYDIRFRNRAKEELWRSTQNYGAKFADDLGQWLKDIAISAEKGDLSGSLDMLQLLEEGIDAAKNPNTWKESWRRWLSQSMIEKAKTLVTVLRKRTLPWRLRATSRSFYRILDAFDCEVQTIFEVDHVNNQVVFVKFIGLPGEAT